MTPVYHVVCGGLAFSFTCEPYDGMQVAPDLVVYPDGSSPPDKTKALCATCMEDMEVAELSLVPPREVAPLPAD
jgi:hypothetical protein